MKFGLAITLTPEVEKKTGLIQSLSDDMKDYFKNKNYGNDIKTYTIGIICISPQFDLFFKERKPKYTKGKKETIQHGIPFTLEDNFEYSVKIDFEHFKNAEEEETKKILAREVLTSLAVFKKMAYKIKDFDVNSFKADLEQYFKSNTLM